MITADAISFKFVLYTFAPETLDGLEKQLKLPDLAAMADLVVGKAQVATTSTVSHI